MMKKLLLMFFVAIGAVNGIFAMENSGQTADELAVDTCMNFLNLDPNEVKSSYDRHWLLIKQWCSLNYLTHKMNSDKKMSVEEKQETLTKLNDMGVVIRQDLNLLREREAFVKKIKNKINKIRIDQINEINFEFCSLNLEKPKMSSVKIEKLIRKDKMNRE
jgi:hypothetical protein